MEQQISTNRIWLRKTSGTNICKLLVAKYRSCTARLFSAISQRKRNFTDSFMFQTIRFNSYKVFSYNQCFKLNAEQSCSKAILKNEPKL